MTVAAEPPSLAKEDIVPWAVAAKGYTGDKAVFATAAGRDAYDWMAARAGMLNPDQLEEQQEACAAYVRMLAEKRDGACGAAINAVGTTPAGDGLEEPPKLPDGVHPVGFGFILGWIIASLIWNLVTYLFWHMVKEPKNMAAFKAMHAPTA